MELIKEKQTNVLMFMYEDEEDSYMLLCNLNSKNELINIHEMLLDKENDEYFDMGAPHNNIEAQEKGVTLVDVLNILKSSFARMSIPLVDIKYIERI